jgi:hypothetical protein
MTALAVEQRRTLDVEDVGPLAAADQDAADDAQRPDGAISAHAWSLDSRATRTLTRALSSWMRNPPTRTPDQSVPLVNDRVDLLLPGFAARYT